ncbi:hypothetical protein IWW55_007233 [Coemansia sp. RSA 2706]|nr:hypothetical protein IWW55_007233 [Coemansia sp. RSA 2706]
MCTAELPAGRWLVSDERVYDTLQNIIGDPRIRRFLVELLQEAEVQELLGVECVDDIRLGASEVTKRIDSSHFWRQFGIQPLYPFVCGQPDPADRTA